MSIKSLVPVLLFLLIGCGTPETESVEYEYPTTESEVLNEFIRQAPVQYIDLDEIETTAINLDESHIIYDLQSDDSEPIISNIRYFTANEGTFFVYSWTQNKVFGIDREGRKYSVTREGRGPGEHSQLWDNFAVNSNSVYLGDSNNARITKYSRDFELEETFNQIFAERLVVNDEIMAFANSKIHGMFAPDIEGEGLVVITPINAPKDTLTTIMPKIVPSGHQPLLFNRVDVAMNESRIAASYSPLPWIFLFDEEYNLERTLIFDDVQYDTLETIPLRIEKPKPDEPVGGVTLLSKFIFMDNGDLLLGNNEMEHLTRNEDGTYKHVGSYDVTYPEAERPFWIDRMILKEDNKVAASNWYYLFEFELPTK